MLKESILEKNKQMLESFLIDRKIDKSYKLDDEVIPFGFIYCIENINNKKKYIGYVYSVWVANQRPLAYTQLRKRASNYLYEYNYVLKNGIENSKKFLRPIIKAMIEEGFENFIMYPIAETTRLTHFLAENYFINLFNTINNGYNKNRVNISNKYKTKSTYHSAEAKKLRSEPVFCINPATKEIIHSDSLKLFGDYMNSAKDMMKNTVRKGRPYKGWFIFYVDNQKRELVLYKNILNDNQRPQDRLSESAKNFYKDLYNIVGLYLKTLNPSEYFPNFKILDPLIYKN